MLKRKRNDDRKLDGAQTCEKQAVLYLAANSKNERMYSYSDEDFCMRCSLAKSFMISSRCSPAGMPALSSLRRSFSRSEISSFFGVDVFSLLLLLAPAVTRAVDEALRLMSPTVTLTRSDSDAAASTLSWSL